jgi:hypothetical protein
MRKNRQDRERGESNETRLSPKLHTQLKRQFKDLDDPTRYVIVAAFSPTFCLYYWPQDGNYVMNEIPDGALFKRKAEAQAVAKILDRGRKHRIASLQVIAVRKTKRGIQFIEHVTDPWKKSKRWKPKLQRQRPNKGKTD